MNRKSRKLALSRETLRRLEGAHLGMAHGGATRVCNTEVTDCAVCYTTNVTDCPDCVFTEACQSLGCESGVNTCTLCAC